MLQVLFNRFQSKLIWQVLDNEFYIAVIGQQISEIGHAWAELEQAQVKLELIVQVGVGVELDFGVELLILVVGWVVTEKSKLMLFPTQVTVVIEVEVKVEFGNLQENFFC